jgi:hypothetical protein
MRPIYERDHDRVAQAQAVGALARATGTEAMPTPPLTFYDYEMLRDGKPVAIVEVKRRYNRISKYPTYKIGTRKLNEVQNEADSRDMIGIILVQWDDALGYVSLRKYPASMWEVKENDGRTVKTRDKHDIEPMSYAKIPWFTMLEVT